MVADMKRIKVGGVLPASAVALGCMRINALDTAEAAALLNAAVDGGVDFFDHADIYGGGESERVFARAVKAAGISRDKMIIQTKCGIRPGVCFDFSREHILSSVEESLKRLDTDYVDVLLLHRPDTLVEPEEVAEAFDRLHAAGKVRYFGVSNQNPMQMELLSAWLHQKLIANQLQFGPAHTGMIDAGIHVNMLDAASTVRDGGVLEYCRLKDITIQPWSPFQFGFFEGIFLDSDRYEELNRVLRELAEAKGVGVNAMVMAWILRHPAQMQPIAGTTKAARLTEICRGAEAELTREEWYAVYKAAGNILP